MSVIRGIYINPALRVVQVDTIENDREVIADEIGAIALDYYQIKVGNHTLVAIVDSDAGNKSDIGTGVRRTTKNGRSTIVCRGIVFIVGVDNKGIRSLTDEESSAVLAQVVRTKRNLYLLV